MKYIDIKCSPYTNDVVTISQIVMGSADYFRADNIEHVLKMFNLFKEYGVNTIDTARHYRHSDIAIKALLENGVKRDEIVILAKGCHPVREEPDTPRVNREAIITDLNESLERIGVEYVDLFALHRDDVNTDVKEIIDTLNVLVNEGKIKTFGCSNWELDRIKEANEYALKNNLIPFMFNSANFSLCDLNTQRWPGCVSLDTESINYHTKNNFLNIAWSAQAEGFFSGRFEDPNNTEDEFKEVYYNDRNFEKLERVRKLANHLEVAPIQISLAYVLHQDFPCAAIVGSETLEELAFSLEASKINLDKKMVEYLDLKSNEFM